MTSTSIQDAFDRETHRQVIRDHAASLLLQLKQVLDGDRSSADFFADLDEVVLRAKKTRRQLIEKYTHPDGNGPSGRRK